MNEVTAIALFPTLVFVVDVPEYKDLLPEVYKLQRQDPTGMQASNMGGWHSQWVDIPELVREYIPFENYIGTAWYMINQSMHGNFSHVHPRNDWSGVLWLRVPEQTNSLLEFEHPDLFAQYQCMDSVSKIAPDIQKQYNYWQSYKFPPKEGTMLMFPASLRDHVHFNQSEDTRIALSFNIKL